MEYGNGASYRLDKQSPASAGFASAPKNLTKAGASNEKILLQVSEGRFYVVSVLYVRFKGLFLNNAEKNVSVRIR